MYEWIKYELDSTWSQDNENGVSYCEKNSEKYDQKFTLSYIYIN